MQVSSPPWITPLLYFIIIFVCTFLVAYFSGMAVPGKPSPWPFCCLCHSLSVSLKEYHAWLPPQPQVFAGQCEHDSCLSTFWLHQTTCLKLLNIALATISRQMSIYQFTCLDSEQSNSGLTSSKHSKCEKDLSLKQSPLFRNITILENILAKLDYNNLQHFKT